MSLKNRSLKGEPAAPAPAQALDEMSPEDLLALREQIDIRLAIDITKLNLADELGLQYQSGMILLASIREDKDVPPNQKAQVMNSVSATLKEIIKQTKVVYSAERLKRYEAAVLKVLKELPEENRMKFFNLYGDYLKDPEAGNGS